MIKFFFKTHRNRLKKLLTLVFLTIIFACSENKTDSINISDEVSQIRKPILELYQNLKVENEITPNFNHVFSLFTKSSELGYVKEDSLILKTPEEYFSGIQGGIDAGIIKLLHEWEIKGETEYFGNIAHHLSTYGVYFGTTDSIAERGITSFQLVKVKGDWKIQSMIWKAENDSLRIQSRYLEN